MGGRDRGFAKSSRLTCSAVRSNTRPCHRPIFGNESAGRPASDMAGCTDACRTPVNCTVCGLRKNPVGRSASLEMCNSLCDWECEGYQQDPKPPHLWPNEPLTPEG